MRMRHLCILTAVATLLVYTACGGTTESESAAEPEDAGAQQESGTQETAEVSSPEALAENAYQLYRDALNETVDALADEPEAETTIELVTAIRDKYAAKLVEIGKKRDTLDEAGKGKFDAMLRTHMMYDIPTELYERYRDVQKPYSTHPVAGKLTAAINIITQYTNFDLLSKQEPEEARKYGVFREVEK